VTGHVRKRGKSWAYVVDLPPGQDGARRQRWRSGFRTRREAERALAQTIGQVHRGEYVERSRLSVGAYLSDEWLPAIRSSVRPSTHASYSMIVRTRIVPRLGGVALQALTPAMLNGMHGELLAAGGRDGRPLSARSVRLTHATIRKALADAARWGLLGRNVADLADPPSADAERRSRRAAMETWSAEQLRAFLGHVAEDRLAALWHLAATTGMRRGELAGLHWADVDLDAGRLAVSRSLVSVDYALVESGTKSGKVRVIDLDSATVAALRAHHRRQAAERISLGPAYQDRDQMFCREDGEPIHPEQITRLFRRHQKALGLPRIRLHDMRHTHGTLLIEGGVHPKVVQERLGHHSVAFTLDVYAHVTPAMQAQAAAAFADLVDGGRLVRLGARTLRASALGKITRAPVVGPPVCNPLAAAPAAPSANTVLDGETPLSMRGLGAGVTGLEPAASGLTVRCSNQSELHPRGAGGREVGGDGIEPPATCV
jgi:integrase